MRISNALTLYYNPVNNEYSFQRQSASDIRFDSLLEKIVFNHLKEVVAQSLITIKPKLVLVGKNTDDPVTWCPDFLVNKKIVVEAKGYITQDFAVKARIFKHVYPTLDFVIAGNEFHLKKHLPKVLHNNIVDLGNLRSSMLELVKEKINDSKERQDLHS